MQFAIETHALTKSFPKLDTYHDLLRFPWQRAEHTALNHVSLQIKPGELFGILGQNGAGKTTLIKILSTSLLPSSGSAHIAGCDIVRDPQRVRAMIGLINSEERSFYWRLTGRQNLQFFAALYHVPSSTAKRRIDSLLHQVGLTDFADRPFQTYSSGMRQKLAIARGMLNEPQVLFMDEPTRSLDPISAQAIRGLITEYIIGELGRTVVLATHSMSEAEALCNRIALIRTGRVVAEGSIDHLRQVLHYGVRCELCIRYMPPELPESLRRIAGVIELDVEVEGSLHLLRLVLTEEGPVLAAVLRETVEYGGEVYGCSTHQVSLEEIYVRTLGAPADTMEMSLC